jgi:hypothetical protein
MKRIDMLSYARSCAIFAPTWGALEHRFGIDEIADLVNGGQLKLWAIEIPFLSFGSCEFPDSRSTESVRHLELKVSVYHWLLSLGSKNCGYERECWHGKADVYAEDFDAVAECGNTPPSRIESLLIGGHRLMIVAPYCERSGGTTTVYVFMATPAGLEYGGAVQAARREMQRAAMKTVKVVA